MKCLLIQTKDKRKFFTHEKNFVQLIEFSKTFGAEISMVKLEEGPILELKELAPAICDPSYKKRFGLKWQHYDDCGKFSRKKTGKKVRHTGRDLRSHLGVMGPDSVYCYDDYILHPFFSLRLFPA